MATGKVQTTLSIVEEGTTTDSASDTWNYRKWSNGDIDLWINKDSFSFSGSDTTLNGWHRRTETRTLSILQSILWVSATGANSNFILTGALPTSSTAVQFIQSGISATAATIWVVCHIKGRYA